MTSSTLRCPRCGSHRPHLIDREHPKAKEAGLPESYTHIALCKDEACGYISAAKDFRGLSAEYDDRYPNQHWRDPIAMSMDGYPED